MQAPLSTASSLSALRTFDNSLYCSRASAAAFFNCIPQRITIIEARKQSYLALSRERTCAFTCQAVEGWGFVPVAQPAPHVCPTTFPLDPC